MGNGENCKQRVGRVPRHAAAATTAVQRRFTHRKIFER
nr:MAG TPA: hypothetical protein [Caudoviricetes sp.]